MSERLIPYQPLDISEPHELVDAIRQRRGGELINLDRMLLHSIPVARGWNAFLGELRQNLSLHPKLRELVMCAVAILNGAEYEFVHHSNLFLQAGGTEEQLISLRAIKLGECSQDCFDSVSSDVISLTIQMTRNIKVSDDLMARLKGSLGDTCLVELVTVVGAYNMVSRVLIALKVEPEGK